MNPKEKKLHKRSLMQRQGRHTNKLLRELWPLYLESFLWEPWRDPNNGWHRLVSATDEKKLKLAKRAAVAILHAESKATLTQYLADPRPQVRALAQYQFHKLEGDPQKGLDAIRAEEAEQSKKKVSERMWDFSL